MLYKKIPAGAIGCMQAGGEATGLCRAVARRCEVEVVLLTVAEASPFAVASQDAISGPVYQQQMEHSGDQTEACLWANRGGFREKGLWVGGRGDP